MIPIPISFECTEWAEKLKQKMESCEMTVIYELMLPKEDEVQDDSCTMMTEREYHESCARSYINKFIDQSTYVHSSINAFIAQ